MKTTTNNSRSRHQSIRSTFNTSRTKAKLPCQIEGATAENLTQPEAFDNVIMESEEIDDKLTQNIDVMKHFTKRFKRSSAVKTTALASMFSESSSLSTKIKLPNFASNLGKLNGHQSQLSTTLLSSK